MLDHYQKRLASLRETGFFAAEEGRPVKVVSLACGGTPVELEVLSGVFDRMHYFGIDLEYFPDWERFKSDTARFRQLDATDVKAVCGFVGKQADIVVVRHPVFSEKGTAYEAFQTIFIETIPALLKEGGKLIVSCYHPEEFDSCLGLLKFLSQEAPCILTEDTTGPLAVEMMSISDIGDCRRELFADRFMLGCRFVPTLALQAQSVLFQKQCYAAPGFAAIPQFGFFKRRWLGLDCGVAEDAVIFEHIGSAEFQERLLQAESFNSRMTVLLELFDGVDFASNFFPVETHRVLFAMGKGPRKKRERVVEKLTQVMESVLYLALIQNIKKELWVQQVFYAATLASVLIAAKMSSEDECVSQKKPEPEKIAGYFGF